jgi:hypothetical protein
MAQAVGAWLTGLLPRVKEPMEKTAVVRRIGTTTLFWEVQYVGQ